MVSQNPRLVSGTMRGTARCRLENLKSAIGRIGDASRKGRLMRREAQANVLELSKELNEVNMDLQSVFMQLRCAAPSICMAICGYNA